MTTEARLAECLASRALEAAGWCADDDALPALSRLAQAFDVHTELAAGLCAEGQVKWSAGATRIEIAESHQLSRTKFTYAHELAHVIVRSQESSFPRLRVLERRHGIELERFCDQLAGALLLPATWLKGYLADGLSVTDLLAVGSAADVSPTAVAVRIRQLGVPNILLLLRRTRGNRWFVSSAAGMPNVIRRRSALGESVRNYINLMDLRSVAEEEIEVCARRLNVNVPASISKLNNDCALVLFPGMSCNKARGVWKVAHDSDVDVLKVTTDGSAIGLTFNIDTKGNQHEH